MSDYMLWNSKQAAVRLEAPLVLDQAPLSGLFFGTKLATPDGWRAVETLRVGDVVMSSGQGDQAITDLETGELSVRKTLAAARQWPLMVPAGALGDNVAMLLSPHMRLVVDGPVVEELFDETRVSLRAEALIGFHGIARARLANELSHTALYFDQPVTLVLEGGGFLDLPGPKGGYLHRPLDDRQARVLIRQLNEIG